jgi:deoxyribodipyrimidine photolyase
MKNLTQVTINLIKAREALEAAKQAEANAVAELKEAYAQKGIKFNVVDGQKVAVERKARKSYDADTLLAMVSEEVFAMVTKTNIDATLFKSAVKMGVIKAEVEKAVVKATEYDSVRVTDIADYDSVRVTDIDDETTDSESVAV